MCANIEIDDIDAERAVLFDLSPLSLTNPRYVEIAEDLRESSWDPQETVDFSTVDIGLWGWTPDSGEGRYFMGATARLWRGDAELLMESLADALGYSVRRSGQTDVEAVAEALVGA